MKKNGSKKSKKKSKHLKVILRRRKIHAILDKKTNWLNITNPLLQGQVDGGFTF